MSGLALRPSVGQVSGMWIIAWTDAADAFGSTTQFYASTNNDGWNFWTTEKVLAKRFDTKDAADAFLADNLIEPGWAIEAVPA